MPQRVENDSMTKHLSTGDPLMIHLVRNDGQTYMRVSRARRDACFRAVLSLRLFLKTWLLQYLSFLLY